MRELLPARCRRRAITLIETLLVISLLAGAAIAGSMLFDGDWVSRRNVATTTNTIADSLVAARNTAITNQAVVRVRRSRQGGQESLTIREEAGPFRNGQTWTQELGSAAKLTGSPREVRFEPSGTTNRPLTWIISQSQSRGEVSVSPSSGMISRRLP